MVVTAKPFARDKAPILLEARNPELEASEDIDPSLDAVSRPRAGLSRDVCCQEAYSLDSKFSSGNRSLKSQ